MMLSRRTFASAMPFAISALVACRQGPAQERCPHCGMLVDRNGPFRAELVSAADGRATGYDAPRCALAASRSGTPGKLRVQEFYTRTYVEGDAVRFVGGSDVEGPMGGELVPVMPDRVEKFMRDHHGERVYRIEDVTAAVLKKEGTP